MKRIMALALLLASMPALGEETATEADDDVIDEQVAAEEAEAAQGDGIDSPKTMSGMSILGNEEAPKALVIVPWKSSQIGDGLGVANSMDERARPVDREVFMRELRYYELRAGSSEQ